MSQLVSQVEAQEGENVDLSEELTQKITTIESGMFLVFSHQESLIARMAANEAKNLQEIALKEDLLEQTEKDLVAKICALTLTSVCLTDAQDEILDIQKKLDEKEEKLEILQVDHCKIMDDFNQVFFYVFRFFDLSGVFLRFFAFTPFSLFWNLFGSFLLFWICHISLFLLYLLSVEHKYGNKASRI